MSLRSLFKLTFNNDHLLKLITTKDWRAAQKYLHDLRHELTWDVEESLNFLHYACEYGAPSTTIKMYKR